jgi:hypothetical protein
VGLSPPVTADNAVRGTATEGVDRDVNTQTRTNLLYVCCTVLRSRCAERHDRSGCCSDTRYGDRCHGSSPETHGSVEFRRGQQRGERSVSCISLRSWLRCLWCGSFARAGGRPPCQPVTGGLSGCFVASSSRVLSLRLSHHRTRSRRCSRCSPSFPWPLSGRTSCCSGTLTGFARPTGLTVQTPTDQSGTPTTDKSRRRQPDSGRRHHPDWSRRRAAV